MKDIVMNIFGNIEMIKVNGTKLCFCLSDCFLAAVL